MTVNEFFIGLNALIKYAFRIVSIDKGKMETFINDLKSDMANDVVMRDYGPNTYSEVMSKTQRLKPKRLRMTK